MVRQTIEVRDFFQTYLMFRPDGLESRYVPLRKINWNWCGKASETNNWTVVADPISEVDAASVEIDQHPEWDDNAENNEEQNVN